MEQFEHTLENGNTLYYKVASSNTYYDYAIKLKDGTLETRDESEFEKLIRALETARLENTRVRVWLGNTDTGVSWNAEYEVVGYIGRSGGQIKIPILLANSRSAGGPALLTRCIIRIDDIKTHKTLYKHPKFNVVKLEIKEPPREIKAQGYVSGVFQKGKNIANFKTPESAQRWVDFMIGKRYNK